MEVAVTGAFGYSGRHITQHLLAAGHRVRTLTGSPDRPNPFGDTVPAYPFDFAQPPRLMASLRGVQVLVNTYWVRFDHRRFNHQQAVANTLTLFAAAQAAGVRRIVHVSITNPDLHSDLPYFRGKAEIEAALVSLNVSHAILRPAVLFGGADVLLNNIAWALRHLPVFGIFGDGDYRLQPIHVDDLARVAREQVERSRNVVLNAIGPETYTYRGLVAELRDTLGARCRLLRVSPAVGYWSCRALGALKRDVVLTREEIRGLMAECLYVDDEPVGETRLSEWAAQHRATLGRWYASELARRDR